MFGKIVVPLDGSAMADRILHHVAALARLGSTSITLVRVLETDDAEATPVDPLAWHFAKAEAHAHLDEAAARLARWGLASSTVLLEGGAAQRIVEYAQSSGADLLVLSSHGKGGLSGWHVSGIALKVIDRAGTSILLVRSTHEAAETEPEADAERVGYHRILAPLDGSQRAESVLPLVSALAERHSADIFIAHVVARPQMIQRVPLGPKDAALAERVVTRNKVEAAKYVAQVESRFPTQIQTRVVADDSVTWALHRLIEQEQVDLVVFSAHGQSCHAEWPYSALVTNFINYGTTSLFILQDLRLTETRAAPIDQATGQPPNMPTRRANEDEGLNDRGQFGV